MSSTFKYWLVANFEIFIFLLTIILCPIFFFITYTIVGAEIADPENVDEETIWRFGFGIIWIILMVPFTLPTKNAGTDGLRYILMFIIVFFFMWWTTQPECDEAHSEILGHIFKWFWKIVLPAATVIGVWIARYTFRNFDEVVSRRMLYRNSNVSLFELRWKYTLNRFGCISVSLVMCLMTLTTFFR